MFSLRQTAQNSTRFQPIHMCEPSMARPSRRRAYTTVFILFLINLLNYMDRFTVAAVLTKIEDYFDVDHSQSGLLQTVFIVTYMLLAPIFGYLGDRYNRKIIMCCGLAAWSVSTFAGTLVQKRHDHFWIFFACRGLVGIGEASYSTVANTVIGDLFIGDMRTAMLSLFYFAIPVGSGLGYIVGSKVALLFDNWKWGLRVTPVFGVVLLILCILFVVEPVRGQVEKSVSDTDVIGNQDEVVIRHGWIHDVKQIFRSKTYVWTTIGFTAVCFCTGGLAWWAPTFMGYAQSVHYNKDIGENDNNISLTFGGVTCAAGFIGVALGSELSRRIRHYDGRADAWVCAFGLLSCLPFLFFGIITASKYIALCWVLLFIGETLLCMNWCPVADMLLAVMPPHLRATASALQILLSHLFGDAGSPYVIGQVADAIRGPSKDNVDEHRGLLYAFFIMPFVCALGGGCFLIASFYLVKDRTVVEAVVRGENEENRSLLSNDLVGDQGEDEEEASIINQQNEGQEYQDDESTREDEYGSAVEHQDTSHLIKQENEEPTTFGSENNIDPTLLPIKV